MTPSQHRVHHALNDIYIDKNLSGVFCIWDRMFGTFQEELEEEPPVYGTTRPLNTWNPIKHNFAHLALMIKDAWRTNNLWDKLRIWFMPTGWRPEDVKVRFPIESVDQHTIVKFDTPASFYLHAWSWAQCIITNVMLFHLLMTFKAIGFPNLFLYGGFLFISIYAYTALMDRDPKAIWFELVKCMVGIGIILTLGNWFELSIATWLVVVYLLISVVMVYWFTQNELKAELVNA